MNFKKVSILFYLSICLGCSANYPPDDDVVGASSLVVRHQDEQLGQMLPVTAKAKLKSAVIELEVARTPEQQAMGLMYRSALPDDRGMLFPFDKARYVRFWMQNVTIPLDMIFLREGIIQAIFANVPPCTVENCPTYGPETPIDRVIELRGGRASELGLNKGDRIDIYFPSSP